MTPEPIVPGDRVTMSDITRPARARRGADITAICVPALPPPPAALDTVTSSPPRRPRSYRRRLFVLHGEVLVHRWDIAGNRRAYVMCRGERGEVSGAAHAFRSHNVRPRRLRRRQTRISAFIRIQYMHLIDFGSAFANAMQGPMPLNRTYKQKRHSNVNSESASAPAPGGRIAHKESFSPNLAAGAVGVSITAVRGRFL
ncbi:hypothetical protein EVAR_62486_1 [Eumeta japonica]|uniref:Uncharacterized protein n=1 Tax=Eumeta variegata TaxID=151549 RepID=A0A4C1ZM59_EUMVA|nr:hypothetical protein EVAR_62486_1 [Eumeta japonica]